MGLTSLWPALKIEELVLVELVDPTSLLMSAMTPSPSSCAIDRDIVLASPFDIPLVRVAPSRATFDEAARAACPCEDSEYLAYGEEGLLRSIEAFDRFCCSTFGAVGKKSAKLEERDIVSRCGYLSHPASTIPPKSFGFWN